MSIQPTVNSAASRYQANSPTESSNTTVNNQTTKPSASELSAENRRQLNQTILDNQLSLSLQSDNKAMNLLYRAISDAVEIPVIASGGVGTLDHLVDGIIKGGADAVLAASIFHFGEYTVPQAKDYMAARGIEVRR